jgi:hypothetical protein
MLGNSHNAPEKALQINLEGGWFGTFAEIGAGQGVARWFFHVGRASSTVAKSISAYDTAISNALYGATDHYVSRARLEAMLDHEFAELLQLGARSANRRLFIFADTVATHGSVRPPGGHGWLGVRFQDRPGADLSEVIVHVEMLDAFSTRQQETVGLLGVNLLDGAFHHSHEPTALIGKLMDGLDRRCVEVDMVRFSGPVFRGVDNRLMSLQLVEKGLTDAAMFTAQGEVVQPSEVLHDKPVLLERGSFRPVTNVTLAMLEAAQRQLEADSGPTAETPVVLMEMTLKNLMSGRMIDHDDFLARADILRALDKSVMISNYTRFDYVTSYLRQYTRNWVALVVGMPTLIEIFKGKYYTELPGGILEGLGKLFSGHSKLFVYPTVNPHTGALATADKAVIEPQLKLLYAHLLQNGSIELIREFSAEQLNISPGRVLEKIQSGDKTWEAMVPAPAVALIKHKGLLGYRRAPVTLTS